MSDYLYLDIETIPTDNPAHIEQIAAAVKPSASITKADTLAAWEKDTKPAKIIEAVLVEEGRAPTSVFDFVQGITAVARDKPHQDARLDLEARAKKLLDRAA